MEIKTECVEQAVEKFAQAMLATAVKDAVRDRPEREAWFTDERRVVYLNTHRERARKLVEGIQSQETLYELWEGGRFRPDNKHTRTLFTEVTGVKLPSSNRDTDHVLRTCIGLDYVKAREEAAASETRKQNEAIEAERLRRLAAEDALYDGFGASYTPTARKRAHAALDVQVRNNGNILTRKELIREKLADGWTVATGPKGRLLVKGDCSFEESTLTKTALDYAEFLLALNAKAVAAVGSAPA